MSNKVRDAGAARPQGQDMTDDLGALAALHPDILAAVALIKADQQAEAVTRCAQVMDSAALRTVQDRAVLAGLLRRLDQTDAADLLWHDITDGPDIAALSGAGDAARLIGAAAILAELGALDEAEDLCRMAHGIAPDEEQPLMRYLSVLTFRKKFDIAETVADAFAARHPDKFDLLLYLAMVFSHFDMKPAVLRFLNMAQPVCRTSTQRAKLNHLLAANGLPVSDLDQHGMAVEIFDQFADSYDDKLAALGNNGPALIFAALVDLGLTRSETRRILDAGCGTGLCAGFLRLFAREITGVDISIKMLEKSRDKGLYDFLARTDLSEAATYPEGRFDMIVCADVLVYFGALNTVFTNFHKSLAPGGWLLFTVEHEAGSDTQAGFRMHPSGRYKHSDGYLLTALADAGFPKPRLLHHAPLRSEMSKTIMGTVIAVQKPALAFG